jgi:hypothetical protein
MMLSALEEASAGIWANHDVKIRIIKCLNLWLEKGLPTQPQSDIYPQPPRLINKPFFTAPSSCTLSAYFIPAFRYQSSIASTSPLLESPIVPLDLKAIQNSFHSMHA